MKEAGMPQLYLENLGPWRQMLGFGLSTFAEKLDPVRSDCHAWSSSPNYFFLSLVCGIGPGTSGYKTVSIRPNPGDLKEVKGAVPHPLGMIRVKYKIYGVSIEAEIELPEGLQGEFVWLGVKRPLTEGMQTISF
ncbi:MAG TPA: alpha-L-rhamnosidase C-terminal domain-containing protein [Cyclobacteriaceae bacterium]|nr:alpha-L-rhamnosidase C-terminal domain-containing protein [Cyclobacteriaceae bacterium]